MDDLRLALFIGSSADIITLAEYLALDAAARSGLEVSPDWACISLLADGKEQWGPRLSFGALEPLVSQFAPAAERLQHGKQAVICAEDLGAPVTEYVVFSPEQNKVVAATAAYDPDEHGGVLPPAQEDEFYRFVAVHLDAMIEAGTRLRELRPVPVDRAAVVTALLREAEIGAQALEILRSMRAG